MNRFATSTILIGGLAASMVGMAGAAHADISDTIGNQQQQQRVHVTPTANGAITNTMPLAAHRSGSATYIISQSDRDGFVGYITVRPSPGTELNGWTLSFNTTAEITSLWNGSITSHVGTAYVVTPDEWTANLSDGSSASIGFQAAGAWQQDPITNLQVKGGAS